MRILIWTLGTLWMLGIGGCSSGATLHIDLITSLRPGVDFDAIRLEVGERFATSSPDFSGDYVAGVRVSSVAVDGDVRVRIALLLAGAEVAVEDRFVIVMGQNHVVQIRIVPNFDAGVVTDSGQEDAGTGRDMSVSDVRPEDTTDFRCTRGCTFVLDQLSFAEGQDGISVGRDIDGETTMNGDSTGCGKQDFVHPDGTPGIDNAMASLIPIFDMGGSNSMNEGVADAIGTGDLLILLAFSDGGEATLFRGAAIRPLELDANNRLNPGQRFQAVTTELMEGGIRAGRLSALANLRLDVPLTSEIVVPFQIQDATFTANRESDQLMAGEISGLIDVQELARAITTSGLDTMGIMLEPILGGQADTTPNSDGTCHAISVALSFHGVLAEIVP